MPVVRRSNDRYRLLVSAVHHFSIAGYSAARTAPALSRGAPAFGLVARHRFLSGLDADEPQTRASPTTRNPDARMRSRLAMRRLRRRPSRALLGFFCERAMARWTRGFPGGGGNGGLSGLFRHHRGWVGGDLVLIEKSDHEYRSSLESFRKTWEAEAEDAAAEAGNALTHIYQNIRTISLLPSVPDIDRHGTNIDADARLSISSSTTICRRCGRFGVLHRAGGSGAGKIGTVTVSSKNLF